MKNHKLAISLIAMLVIALGCKKLDEHPKSFVTPDNFYKSQTQIEATFASSMSALWSAWSTYGYGMAVFANDDQLAGGDLNIPANWGSDLWAAHYSAIMNLNLSISALNKGLPGVSKETTDQLLGQAKFLRAYNYFMLVRMFGSVPLVTEETASPFTINVAKSPIADVYQLIISDFTTAIATLPVTWPDAQRGRPTMDAAKGLLAKAYLTMATYPLNDPSYYQKAADMAAQVIQAGTYSLEPDINKVFSVGTKYGKEMMFSFNSNYVDMATDPHIWSDIDGWGDESAEPLWVQVYPVQPRKSAYLQTQDASGVDYVTLGKLPGIKKYLYDTPEDFEAGRSVVNIPILRFADVLLIFAEADNMAHGGPTQAGVDAINRVIDRANGNVANAQDPRATLALSPADFDAKVIDERSWELCFEYDRWFDLIRKHILKEKSIPSIQQNFVEKDYLFPIPENDLRLDPLLTQNPGY
jgi:hypothetical protein